MTAQANIDPNLIQIAENMVALKLRLELLEVNYGVLALGVKELAKSHPALNEFVASIDKSVAHIAHSQKMRELIERATKLAAEAKAKKGGGEVGNG